MYRVSDGHEDKLFPFGAWLRTRYIEHQARPEYGFTMLGPFRIVIPVKERAAMIPPGVSAIKDNTDRPLWLIVLKRLEVRLALWLEYRFWPWTWELFDDRSRVSRRLARAGWVIGALAMLYVLGHVALAARRGFLLP